MAELTAWLNPQGVFNRYKISVSTLAKWRMTKKNIRFFKDGKYIKYKVSDIEEYLNSNMVEVVV